MTDKQGTGEKIGEIDLEPFATIEVVDNGAHGPGLEYITNLREAMQEYRYENGDEAFLQALSSLSAQGRTTTSTTNFDGWRASRFKCAQCNRTFLEKDNQNPGAGDDICPDCA